MDCERQKTASILHIMSDIELIEKEMIDNGIDVEIFYKKGLLNICKIPNIMEHPKDMIGRTEEIVNKLFCGMIPPFRLVARMINEINTEEE